MHVSANDQIASEQRGPRNRKERRALGAARRTSRKDRDVHMLPSHRYPTDQPGIRCECGCRRRKYTRIQSISDGKAVAILGLTEDAGAWLARMFCTRPY
jgi:hypothetical protein